MFKIDSGRHTWMAVKWTGLDEEGQQVHNEIELRVELVGLNELQAQTEDDSETPIASSADFFKSKVKDWRGVGDADGNPLPFSTENFSKLLDVPGFVIALGPAYKDCWQGISGIREKNLKPSHDNGSAAGEASQTKEA